MREIYTCVKSLIIRKSTVVRVTAAASREHTVSSVSPLPPALYPHFTSWCPFLSFALSRNDVSSDGAAGDVTADSALSENAARATMFARVVSLMNGRSGLRAEVLTVLCDMLNNGITPLLPKEGGEGSLLAKAVLGAGSCLFKGEVRCVNHNNRMFARGSERLD